MKTARKLKPLLRGVDVKGVTIHFEYDEKMPQSLLKKIIKTRMKETDEAIALTAKKKRR